MVRCRKVGTHKCFFGLHINACVRMRECVCQGLCVPVCVFWFSHVYMSIMIIHMYINKYIYIYIYIYIYVYIYIYIYICVCVCVCVCVSVCVY